MGFFMSDLYYRWLETVTNSHMLVLILEDFNHMYIKVKDMSGQLDYIHLTGVDFIHTIQLQFKHHSDLMLFLTKVGDPRYAFLIYFPIAFCLRRSTGVQVVWLAVLSEWLNCVLKWILQGDRPYWWVHEITHRDHLVTVPDLQQYPLTCETGPGSPSGHAMVTSAVLFTIATSFLKHAIQNTGIIEKSVVWVSFSIILIAVNISRLYIATHFPHQVIAGTVTGIMLAAIVKHEHVSNLSLLHYVVSSTTLALGAAGTFYIIKILGLNPFWSIDLAMKWCASPDWVHPDTTPFWSLVRDVASLFGVGVSLTMHTNSHNASLALLPRCLQAAMTVVVTMVIEGVKVPHEVAVLFYIGGFVKYFTMMIMVVVVIPKMFTWLFRTDNNKSL